MTIIDTLVFLWLLNGPSWVEPEHMEFKANKILLSAIRIAELMIKKSLGKLSFNFNAIEMAANMMIEINALNTSLSTRLRKPSFS